MTPMTRRPSFPIRLGETGCEFNDCQRNDPAVPNIQSQARRCEFVFNVMLVATFILSVSLSVTARAQDEPTIIRLPHPTVRLEVSNPDKRNLELWHPSQPKEPLLRFNQTQSVFQLDEGKYAIIDQTSKTVYPVPAIAAACQNQPLKLTIEKVTLESVKRDGELIRIPAGPALIGDEIGVGPKDEPLSIANVPSFWIQRHEVTNQQYVEFLNDTQTCDPDWLDLGSRKCRIQKVVAPNVETTQFQTDKPKQPVVMVSLSGAKAYCHWLSQKTGHKYRLPTETEWEKAARGPYSSVYAYGDRYKEGLANQESGEICDIKRFRPSAWGLYDMTGNVFEWMSNQYDPKQPAIVMNQSLRGGSYVLDGMYLRNSFRMRQSPTVMTDDIGFRVVREAK